MSPALDGKRVLLVEDEALVAMLLETIIEDMGASPVGAFATIEEALAAVEGEGPFDVALLDVNLAGREVFPVAEALKARGVPVVFSTGYGEGGLSEDWRGSQVLQKPFTEQAVREALEAVLAG